MNLFKKRKQIALGEIRTKIKFAFFPKMLSDGSVIWLEKYKSHQEYIAIFCGFEDGYEYCWMQYLANKL